MPFPVERVLTVIPPKSESAGSIPRRKKSL